VAKQSKFNGIGHFGDAVSAMTFRRWTFRR